MSWLSEIFLNGAKKETIGKQDKAQMNRLVMIAALENRIEPSDINLLIEQLPFIQYDEWPDKHHQILEFKRKLPMSSVEKFKLIFLLIQTLMRHGALSEKKETMLVKIIQVLHVRREKSKELVSFIKNNIRNGLNMDDSYLRLGYLLEKPRYV